MLFSIIIPVYNVAQYLDRCLESVIQQQYTNFEIILVDDGSTDNSGAICERWAQKDNRIRLLRKSNGGSSSARNIGMNAAIGSYILFLDSDDHWLSDVVLTQIAERIQQTEPDVLIFNLQKEYGVVLTAPYFPSEISIPTDISEEASAASVFENNLWTACAWNKAVKAELINRYAIRFREGVTAEDIEWCYRLAVVAKRFDFLNINVVAYCQRTSSVTGSMSIDKVRCLLNNIRLCIDLSETASSERRTHLMNFIAYQYGTLLHCYSILPPSNTKKAILPSIKNLAYLLDWSADKKITLIRNVCKLLGLNTALWLLSIRASVSRWQHRRSV